MELNHYFKSITVIDQSVDLNNQLHIDRILAHELNPDELIIRFWTTEGVIFGKIDTLLPEFENGLKNIQIAGNMTLIRKAGGLAVACDSGILNLSILYSKETPLIGGLNESYAFGVNFIKFLLQDLKINIEEGEISTSYCPGKYDLSVNGMKFSGMAQYRTKDAVMLMVTICVNGNQQKRCQLIKDFYDKANSLNDPKYPHIKLSSMNTLSALSSNIITVESLKENMKSILTKSKIPLSIKTYVNL